MDIRNNNPLATEKISKLLLKFAVPSIIGMMVSSLYNIVDQIFIGRGVGMLGNAATNVAFPITTIYTAIGLLFGIGGASNFNLTLGRNKKEESGYFMGNTITSLAISGFVLFLIVSIFLHPLINAFGATEQTLPFAISYSRIIAYGIPFTVIAMGTSFLIRADGSPTYAMISMLIGAILNTILDPLFIFKFEWGIEGAAWATVISQIIACITALAYFKNLKTVSLKKIFFKPRLNYLKPILLLGMAASLNQLAMTIVQITMNNTLRYYGSLSAYGPDIPLASVGIISKVNVIFISIVLGIAQGFQPIISFNYGAKNYKRVKLAYLQAIFVATICSVISFLCFQIFPRQIISIFGEGSELYYSFSERYFRIFMLMAFLNGIQPITSNFFTSIGKAPKGIFLSLTRQVIFLLPLIVIFPLFIGIDGVMYAGPIADGAAGILSIIFIYREIKLLNSFDIYKNLTEIS